MNTRVVSVLFFLAAVLLLAATVCWVFAARYLQGGVCGLGSAAMVWALLEVRGNQP